MYPGMSLCSMSDMLYVLVRWIARGPPTHNSVPKPAAPIPPHTHLCCRLGAWRVCINHCTGVTWDSMRFIECVRAYLNSPQHTGAFAACEKHRHCPQNYSCQHRRSGTDDYHVLAFVCFCCLSRPTSSLACRTSACLPEVNYPVKVEVSGSWASRATVDLLPWTTWTTEQILRSASFVHMCFF